MPPPAAAKDYSKSIVVVALVAIALVAYINSFSLGLAQDSKAIVTQDTRIRELNSSSIQEIFTKNYWWPKTGDGLYRPITTLSLAINYAVLGSGASGPGYHVVNFLLHAINTWLVYELALLLFRRRNPAFFAAALWAVHPICTEAVDGIVGRADLLAAMAVLGGLLIYVRQRRSWTPAALFVIATAGVFAKENAAVLIGMMVLWDLCFADDKPRFLQRWPEYLAVAASLVVLFGVRHAVLGALPVPQPVYVDNPIRGAGFLSGELTAIKTVGLDLWLMLFPLTLACDRSFDQIPLSGMGDLWAWISLLVVAALLAAAVWQYRRNRIFFWCAGFLAIALLPTSNLVISIGALIAERFLYLPSIAFAVALVALAEFVVDEKNRTWLLAAVLIVYAGRTLARNPAWNNDLSLATADTQTAPRSFRLHDMLAKALYEKDAAANLDRSIAEQEKSWEILKPVPPEHSSEFPPTFLGIYYTASAEVPGLSPEEKKARFEKAEAVLLQARTISQATERVYDDLQRASGKPLAARVGFQQLYFNLANVELNLRKYPEAVEALRYGQGLDPRAPEAYDGLSVAYTAMNNPDQAAVVLMEKAQLDNGQPATQSALRRIYQKIPEAACAFVPQGDGVRLSLDCPRVKSDFCAATVELGKAFAAARQPDRAQISRDALRRYGCPAAQ